MEHRDIEQEQQLDADSKGAASAGEQAPLNEATKESAAIPGAAASNGEVAPGPPDALPAWRPFYAAVRDAARRLRDS